MQSDPHGESLRWLATYLCLRFAAGVAWLVQHFMGGRSELVQLSLPGAQADERRARIRREDEAVAVSGLKTLSERLEADVERLRADRDYWRDRAEKAERKPLEK